MKRSRLILIGLTAAGLLARLFFMRFEFVMNTDGIQYMKLAQRVATGNFFGFLDPYWSPLYPFLIAIPAFFTSDLELPGRLISLIFGSLLPIPGFLLARRFYNTKVGLIAASLISFYGHYIANSINVVPDGLYYFLFALILYIGWNAVRNGDLGLVMILGILLGLGYLTRPEAIGYVSIFAVLIMSGFFSLKKTILKQRVRLTLLFLISFFLIASPYLFYLRQATGSWTISAKLLPHLIGGNFAEASPLGIPQVPPQTIWGIVKTVFSTLIYNFHLQHNYFSALFPPLMIGLAVIGLFGGRWSPQRRGRETYLILFFLATFVAYLLTVIELRYMMTYLVILMIWAARGILQFRKWLNVNLPDFKLKNRLFATNSPIFIILTVIFVSCYALPTTGILRTEAQEREFILSEEKYAGLWLEKNTVPNPRILSSSGLIAFYARGTAIQLKAKNPAEIMTQAQSDHVDFIVMSERREKESFELSSLLREKPDLFPLAEIYQDDNHLNYKLIVYRVLR